MRVKMMTSMAGPTFVRDAGQEYEVADAEAQRMIAAGIAAPVRGGKVERADVRTTDSAETMARRDSGDRGERPEPAAKRRGGRGGPRKADRL